MEKSQTVFNKAKPEGQPKILFASQIPKTRHIHRPMMLNMWTQTTCEDFDHISPRVAQQNQTERDLIQKVRMLEEHLRVQAGILAQIHETSARQIYINPQGQIIFDPESRKNLPVHNKISPQQAVNEIPKESSVNYRIITDDAETGDPIEIQLAEQETALNINSSADSERLEICLNEDNVPPSKKESPISPKCVKQSANALNDIFPLYIKRPRTDSDSNAEQSKLDGSNTNCNYFFNEHGVLKATPSSLDLITQKTPVVSKQSLLTKPQLTQFKSEEKINIENVMVSIGPNNTRIPAKLYENMCWTSASIATRKLLMAVFDRKTLATHSMTGKPSPAFKDHGKPLKKMLDKYIIEDIIFAVTHKCNASAKEVRTAITTKCADENKMMKLQVNKDRSLREVNNKENLHQKKKLNCTSV